MILSSINPATGKVIRHYEETAATEVEKDLAVMQAAFDDGQRKKRSSPHSAWKREG